MALIEKKLYKNFIKQITDSDKFSTPEDVLKTWNEVLVLRKENIETAELGLRNPQLGGIYAALAHWTYSDRIATVVMPTGTGKTETMLSLLILAKCPILLVIVPTDSLRDQISNKFVTLGILKNEIKVLDKSALYPVVGILN